MKVSSMKSGGITRHSNHIKAGDMIKQVQTVSLEHFIDFKQVNKNRQNHISDSISSCFTGSSSQMSSSSRMTSHPTQGPQDNKRLSAPTNLV